MANRCFNCGLTHNTRQAQSDCNEAYRRRREEDSRVASTPSQDPWVYTSYDSTSTYDSSPSCDFSSPSCD